MGGRNAKQNPKTGLPHGYLSTLELLQFLGLDHGLGSLLSPFGSPFNFCNPCFGYPGMGGLGTPFGAGCLPYGAGFNPLGCSPCAGFNQLGCSPCGGFNPLAGSLPFAGFNCMPGVLPFQQNNCASISPFNGITPLAMPWNAGALSQLPAFPSFPSLPALPAPNNACFPFGGLPNAFGAVPFNGICNPLGAATLSNCNGLVPFRGNITPLAMPWNYGSCPC